MFQKFSKNKYKKCGEYILSTSFRPCAQCIGYFKNFPRLLTVAARHRFQLQTVYISAGRDKVGLESESLLHDTLMQIGLKETLSFIMFNLNGMNFAETLSCITSGFVY